MDRAQHRLTGWARALADDMDTVVVERLVDGQLVEHTAFERRAAVIRLRKAGMSQRRIADQLQLSERQVCRDLTRAGLTKVGWLTQARRAAASRRAAIPALHAAGMLIAEIALLFRVTPGVITNDYRQLGLPTPGPGGTKRCRSRSTLTVVYGHLLPEAVA